MQQTRDRIIADLFTSKNFLACINKMEPAHLRDDLRQEVALIVCEWSDDKVISLHSDGALNFYVVRVIINQIQSNTSPFFKKYRQFISEYKDRLYEKFEDAREFYDDRQEFSDLRLTGWNKKIDISDSDSDHEQRAIREEIEDYTIEQIDSLYWYDRDMIKLYMSLGTYRAIEAKTGIPFISCYKNIQKSIEILRLKSKAPKPVFSKNELKYIQNGKD